MISAKLNGLTPSKFVQQQMIRLGQLSTDACCEKADECQRTNWLLKATLERQLPPNVRAVMANVKYDGQEYLNTVDKVLANVQSGTASAAASLEMAVSAMEAAGVDRSLIAAVRENRNRKGRKANGQQNRGASDKTRKCKRGSCPDRHKPLCKCPEDAKVKKDEAAAVADNLDD